MRSEPNHETKRFPSAAKSRATALISGPPPGNPAPHGAGTEVRKTPLNAVFSVPCHVAILRVMFRFPVPASGRRIAREAGVNHQACADGLKRLESFGIVNREVLGRAHAYTLNVGNPVVDELLVPLYRKENTIADHRDDFSHPAPLAGEGSDNTETESER